MLEIAVPRVVKGDDNRHSFAERKPRFALATTPTITDLPLTPKGFKSPTKVIHVAKQFRKIHEYPLHFGFLA
jgi:hypothetical protein